MSSHPGSTLEDAIELALCLKKNGYAPEQVQDYYPTPGTASTVMYYTGINPLTMKPVYVATDYHEKQLQRALLQFNRPQNADLVREALTRAGRTDLIGYDKDCLVRPTAGGIGKGRTAPVRQGQASNAAPKKKNAHKTVKKGNVAPTRKSTHGRQTSKPNVATPARRRKK